MSFSPSKLFREGSRISQLAIASRPPQDAPSRFSRDPAPPPRDRRSPRTLTSSPPRAEGKSPCERRPWRDDERSFDRGIDRIVTASSITASAAAQRPTAPLLLPLRRLAEDGIDLAFVISRLMAEKKRERGRETERELPSLLEKRGKNENQKLKKKREKKRKNYSRRAHFFSFDLDPRLLLFSKELSLDPKR